MHRIRARSGSNLVVPIAPGYLIVPRAGADEVIASAGEDLVVAAPREDHVVARRTHDGVSAVRARECGRLAPTNAPVVVLDRVHVLEHIGHGGVDGVRKGHPDRFVELYQEVSLHFERHDGLHRAGRERQLTVGEEEVRPGRRVAAAHRVRDANRLRRRSAENDFDGGRMAEGLRASGARRSEHEGYEAGLAVHGLGPGDTRRSAREGLQGDPGQCHGQGGRDHQHPNHGSTSHRQSPLRHT